MYLASLLLASLAVLPAALLATVVWLAMGRVEEELEAFDAQQDLLPVI